VTGFAGVIRRGQVARIERGVFGASIVPNGGVPRMYRAAQLPVSCVSQSRVRIPDDGPIVESLRPGLEGRAATFEDYDIRLKLMKFSCERQPGRSGPDDANRRRDLCIIIERVTVNQHGTAFQQPTRRLSFR
jgi:hypothetical protein